MRFGLVFAVVLAASQAAAQETSRHVIGAGGEAVTLGALGTTGAITAMFDLRQSYVEALVSASYREDLITQFVGGGRFYYIVDRGASADFAIGAGLGFVWLDPDFGDSDVGLWMGAGAKIRAFIVPSVALTAAVGIDTLFIDDGTALDLRGDLGGSLGAIYFF